MLLARAIKIKNAFSKYKFIKIKYHEIESSLLEAVFARGDSSLNELLIRGYENGCYFDGWREFFNFSKWEKSFEELNIDYHKFIDGYSDEIELPWSKVDLKLSPAFLVNELKKAQEGETTEGCLNHCTNCGYL